MSEPAVTKCLQEFQKALSKLEIDIKKSYTKTSNSKLIENSQFTTSSLCALLPRRILNLMLVQCDNVSPGFIQMVLILHSYHSSMTFFSDLYSILFCPILLSIHMFYVYSLSCWNRTSVHTEALLLHSLGTSLIRCIHFWIRREGSEKLSLSPFSEPGW